MKTVIAFSLATILSASAAAPASAAPVVPTGAAAVEGGASAVPVSAFDDRRRDRRTRAHRRTDRRDRLTPSGYRDGTGPNGFADRPRGTRFIGGVDVNRGRLIGNIPGGIGATGR